MNTPSEAYAASLWRFYRRLDHDEPQPPDGLSWSQAEAIVRQVYFEFTRTQLTQAARTILRRGTV